MMYREVKIASKVLKRAHDDYNYLKRKKIIRLTNKQKKSYKKTKICYICKTKFEQNYTNNENYRKLKDHCYYTGKIRAAADNISNLKYSISMEVFVVFHIGWNYDYHFIIKELAKEIEEELIV